MRVRQILLVTGCIWLVPFFASAQEGSQPASRRPFIGIRIESFASTLFTTSTAQASTTRPVADYTYSGSSNSPKLSLGPVAEFRLSEHLTVGPELRFHHAEYQQVNCNTSVCAPSYSFKSTFVA